MSDALDFMLAARRSEMQGLQTLELTCELVSGVSQLVHSLQRERGFSNMLLSSRDERFRKGLDGITADSQATEAAVRAGFDRLDLHSGCGAEKARLFNRIAFVLHSLDGLAALRQKVRRQELTTLEATQIFSRLIGGLLAVVFEAADTAVDPQVTRSLVALFNFMQGKELAGLERATGVTGFATGYFDTAGLEKMRYLEEAQRRCFEIFAEFSEPAVVNAWKTQCSDELGGEIAKLRQVAARTSVESRVQAPLGEVWFDLASRRIDGMKQIEDHLTQQLRSLCHDKISHAQADLDNHRELLGRLVSLDQETGQPATRLFNVQASQLDNSQAEIGSQVSRSLLDVLHAQTLRMQTLSDELEAARRSLSERKLIERAKAALMAHHGLKDDEAYRLLQKTAMERCQRLADVAQTVLTYTGLLQNKPGSSFNS